MSYLKGFRVMAGFTQDDLASVIKKSRALYNYKENGKRAFTSQEERLLFEAIRSKIPEVKREQLFPPDE